MDVASGGILATIGAALLIGFVGSVHCLGMCGGIAGALGHALPPRGHRVATALYPGLYSAGRITSYALAGGAVGALGHGFASASGLGIALRLAAGLLMIGIALHVGGLWNGMALLERTGLGVWRRLLPWAGRLGPPDRPSRVFAIGMLWGWLPCGLVYSALATASTTGTATSGALFMLGFGVGTLPAVVSASTLGSTSRGLLRSRTTRRAAALLLALFGLWTLFGAIGPSLGHGAGHHPHAPVPDRPVETSSASAPPATVASGCASSSGRVMWSRLFGRASR